VSKKRNAAANSCLSTGSAFLAPLVRRWPACAGPCVAILSEPIVAAVSADEGRAEPNERWLCASADDGVAAVEVMFAVAVLHEDDTRPHDTASIET